MTLKLNLATPRDGRLVKRDLAEFGVARFRDQIFDSVRALWRRRKSEGWTQKQVADLIGRDTGWVSKNLRAPGNWTLGTAGEFIQALNGEAEIKLYAIEDAVENAPNYDAYEGYISLESTRNFIASDIIAPRNSTQINIGIGKSWQTAWELPA